MDTRLRPGWIDKPSGEKSFVKKQGWGMSPESNLERFKTGPRGEGLGGIDPARLAIADRLAADRQQSRTQQAGPAPRGLSALEKMRGKGAITDVMRRSLAADEAGGRPKLYDPDYPNPLPTHNFMMFGSVAMLQDLVPAFFDLIGIGWIVNYLMLPFTWTAYWWLIVRNAPKPLKGGSLFNPLEWGVLMKPSVLISMAGLVPILGELLPEWTVISVMAYVLVKRYVAGKGPLYSPTGTKFFQGKNVGMLSKAPRARRGPAQLAQSQKK